MFRGSMADTYLNDLRRQLKYFGTWLPGNPISLGDYGTLKGNLFNKIGNIKDDFHVKVETTVDTKRDYIEYKSANGVKVDFKLTGTGNVDGIAVINGQIDITFQSKNAVFFHADKCICNSIKNIRDVTDQLNDLVQMEQWNANHYFVTSLVDSGATTIFISSGKNSAIKLDASGKDLSGSNFASAGMKLSVLSESNVGMKVVAEQGLTPLFRLGIIHDGAIDQRYEFTRA
jgi:hypothetical protein